MTQQKQLFTFYASFDHIENRDIEAHKHRHIEVANFAEFTFKRWNKKILQTQSKFIQISELTSAFNALLVSELDKAGIKAKAYEEPNLNFSFSVVGIDRNKRKRTYQRKRWNWEVYGWKQTGKTYNTFDTAFDYDYQKETNRMKAIKV